MIKTHKFPQEKLFLFSQNEIFSLTGVETWRANTWRLEPMAYQCTIWPTRIDCNNCISKYLNFQKMASHPIEKSFLQNARLDESGSNLNGWVLCNQIVLSCAVICGTKVSPFGNLVPRTATTQKGLETCFLLSTCCQKSPYK